MAVDVVLVITAVVFGLLVMIGALYFVVYFQHPQDKWAAWLPKIVVVFACLMLDFIVYFGGVEFVFAAVGCGQPKGRYFPERYSNGQTHTCISMFHNAHGDIRGSIHHVLL